MPLVRVLQYRHSCGAGRISLSPDIPGLRAERPRHVGVPCESHTPAAIRAISLTTDLLHKTQRSRTRCNDCTAPLSRAHVLGRYQANLNTVCMQYRHDAHPPAQLLCLQPRDHRQRDQRIHHQRISPPAFAPILLRRSNYPDQRRASATVLPWQGNGLAPSSLPTVSRRTSATKPARFRSMATIKLPATRQKSQPDDFAVMHSSTDSGRFV
jgi:hypothetical protein